MENAKIAPLASVIDSLNKANKAAGSMLEYCRKAAELAATQLDHNKPIKAALAEVISAYSPQFVGADANVKQNFSAFLVLHADKKAVVDLKIKSANETKTVSTTAGDMLSKPMTKHTLRDLAKQVREVNDIGRATGGGRKPKTPTAKPTAPDMTDETAFLAWCDNLSEYLLDAVYRPRIDARLIEMGLVLTKTAKGKVVKGTASA
jgi:nucleoid-associated protein YgaU